MHRLSFLWWGRMGGTVLWYISSYCFVKPSNSISLRLEKFFFSVLWIFFLQIILKQRTEIWSSHCFPGLDCLHWGGGSGSSFLCSTHMPMVRASSSPAFLHPSAGYHYTAISLGFKMLSKASTLRSCLTLDILLYYLCWFPICDSSWAHQLPSGSPVFVSEMLLQISPWPRWAQQN